MDLRALRYFQTIAECGSVTRASEILGISQPALSRTIQTLEEELGRPLLRRHGHGVSPTQAGRILLGRSQSLLRQVEEARVAVRQNDLTPSRPPVTLALPPGAGRLLAPHLIEHVRRAGMDLSLKIVGGFSSQIHEWLARGQIDVGCLHDPVPQRGQQVIPLLEEEVLIVGRKKSFPSSARTIGPQDLVDLPLILPSRPNASRRLLDKWSAQGGIWLDAEIEVDDHTITSGLVRAGIGFTLMTRPSLYSDLRGDYIEARSFRPKIYWPLAIVTQSRRDDRELISSLTKLIVDTVGQIKRSTGWPGAKN